MPIAAAINFIAGLFMILILMRVLMSWVQVDPNDPVAQFIFRATEPFLKPVRDVLPPAGGFDFSPIVVIILVQMIARIIMNFVA